jgi:uncharacterized protein YndB with AHSA1/START domain
MQRERERKMKSKRRIPAMVLMGMGLILACGCIGGSESGTLIYSIVINAPPEKVWDAMCNPSNPNWAPTLKGAGITQGKPCEVGWTQEQTYQVLGQTYHVTSVLSEAVPNQRSVLKMGGDFNCTMTSVLAPEGNATRVVEIMEVSGKLPAGMSFDVAKGQLDKEMEKASRNFKEMAEKQ